MTNYISTNYLANSLVLPVMQTQNALANAQIEASSGQYADLGLQLGDQSGYELSLKNQDGLLTALTASNGVATAKLTATTNALDAIRTSAQTALTNLATATGTTSASSLQTIGSTGLQGLIATTNTSANGEYILGGINSAQAPMNDYFSTPTSSAKTAIDSAFQTTFGFAPSDPRAANISASAMQSFLSGAFASQFTGAAWTSNWSNASSTNTSSQIAQGQSVDTSTNANQPGFQEIAQAYAMMSEFGGSPFSQAARQAVSTAATSLLTSGLTSMTTTEANVGAAKSSVTQATSAMSSQMTILQTQIGNLDNVNADAVATKISLLTTQLQTSYELTSRLHSLSLAQYLPSA